MNGLRMTRTKIQYTNSFRCECGRRIEVRSNKPSLLFHVETCIARASMAEHRAFYCELTTFHIKGV